MDVIKRGCGEDVLGEGEKLVAGGVADGWVPFGAGEYQRSPGKPGGDGVEQFEIVVVVEVGLHSGDRKNP